MERNTVHKAGKRKKAIARATVKDGQGIIRVNGVLLARYGLEAARMRIEESLMVAGDIVPLDKLNIKVNVEGGGVMGQADAVASSIARALVEWSGGDELLERYHSFDRTLIAGDHRLTEPHKPGQSSKGPRHKRQKSYR